MSQALPIVHSCLGFSTAHTVQQGVEEQRAKVTLAIWSKLTPKWIGSLDEHCRMCSLDEHCRMPDSWGIFKEVLLIKCGFFVLQCEAFFPGQLGNIRCWV